MDDVIFLKYIKLMMIPIFFINPNPLHLSDACLDIYTPDFYTPPLNLYYLIILTPLLFKPSLLICSEPHIHPCVDLYSLLGVQSLADVVRHGRLKWFGHLERIVNDWVSDCRKVEVAGARCMGRNRKTWKECVDEDISHLILPHLTAIAESEAWAIARDQDGVSI